MRHAAQLDYLSLPACLLHVYFDLYSAARHHFAIQLIILFLLRLSSRLQLNTPDEMIRANNLPDSDAKSSGVEFVIGRKTRVTKITCVTNAKRIILDATFSSSSTYSG